MKKRVLSALLALCLTLSLAGAAFAENEPSGDSSSAVSQAVSSVESEPQTQDETVSSDSASGEDQTAAKTESTPAPTETPAASDVAEEEPESTPELEAATEPDTTPAPTEDPEAEVTEKTETDGSVEYTAALETDGQTLNVIVTAPDGAFAEGVEPQLSVTMLTAEDELNAVADKLDTAEVQYDGFAALDITFTDEATGEEVEPVKSVAVRIELPQAIVDSGIDLTTLAVQHLEEDENGNVQNVTEVATLDNGITLSEEAAAAANEAAGVAPMSDMPAEEATAGDAVENPAAVAEFSVDGFSTFTITWNNGYTWAQNSTATVSIECLTTDGEPITTPKDFSITNGETVTFVATNENLQIEGYTFDCAEYKAENGWRDLKTLQANGTWHPGNRDNLFGYYTWTYLINDNNETSSSPSIRIYYTKNEQGGGDTPSQTVTPEPGHEKTVTWNNEKNAYDLTLTVSGTVGSETTPVKVDVLMIVDQSNSMNKSNKLINTKLAMLALIDSLESKTNVDTQYSIVGFSSKNKDFDGNTTEADARILTNTLNGWVGADSAKEKIGTKVTIGGDTTVKDGFSAWGGTNYQAGLRLGKTQLDKAREGATKVVIFLSDGNPTYYIGGGDGSSSLESPSDGWTDTKNEARTIQCDTFYSIRIGDANENYLKDIRDAVNTPEGQSHYQSANDDGSNLTGVFENIADSATKLLHVTNVNVTDTLSDYVEPALQDNGQPVEPYVVIEDENGGTVENNFEISADYDATTKRLTLNFPENYALDSDYTYKVIMSILPSETAELYYAQNGNYVSGMKGDVGTGDHAGQAGFYSNDGPAKLTYRYPNDTEDRTADYKMPVVQVKKSYLILGKALGENTTVGEDETFTFEIGIPAEDAGTYDAQYTSQANVQSLTFKQEEGQSNATATVTLKANEQIVIALPTGTHATVKETTTEGYTQAWYEGQTSLTPNEDGIVSVDLSSTAGQKSTIVCVNTVENETGTLSITKNLVNEEGQALSLPSGESSKSFEFTVTAEGDLAEAVSGQSYKAENASETDQPVLVFGEMSDEGTNPPVAIGQMTVTVNEGSNTGSVTVADLPAGLYTIAESGTSDGESMPGVTGYHWSDVAYDNNYNADNVSANVEKDQPESVEITNKYEHNDVTLTISKKVLGSMGDTSGDFHFVLTLKDGNETYKESIGKDDGTLSYTEADPENDITAGYHFTLSDGDTTTFTIPYGLSAKVVEQTGNGYRTYCREITDTTSETLPTSDKELEDYFKENGSEFGNDTGDIMMDGNKKYQFINFRPIVAPTGLEDNHTKPFGLMVGVAVMAGLALAGSAVVRRRRRWME